MQFLTGLFGGSGNMWLTAAFALGIVVVLIFLVSWVMRMVSGGKALPGRGRQRRLTVVDSLSIDPKRHLIIIRRDNVEHLLLTGGPADLVVESGIPVEEMAPRPAQRPATAPQRPIAPATKSPHLPVEAAGPAEPVRPAPAVEKSNISAFDRIRGFGKPAAERRTPPRHPGLMRPSGPVDPLPVPLTPVENRGTGEADSAKDVVQPKTTEQLEFEDSNAQARAEGRNPDRN